MWIEQKFEAVRQLAAAQTAVVDPAEMAEWLPVGSPEEIDDLRGFFSRLGVELGASERDSSLDGVTPESFDLEPAAQPEAEAPPTADPVRTYLREMSAFT